MSLNEFQYLTADGWIGTDVATIHFPVAYWFRLRILGGHDANNNLRRLAQVRTVERNRRNRPTPVPLSGFLAKAFKESIVPHHIARQHLRFGAQKPRRQPHLPADSAVR
jgi:hypothetical protein